MRWWKPLEKFATTSIISHGVNFIDLAIFIKKDDISRSSNDMKGLGFFNMLVGSDVATLLMNNKHLMNIILNILMCAYPYSLIWIFTGFLLEFFYITCINIYYIISSI